MSENELSERVREALRLLGLQEEKIDKFAEKSAKVEALLAWVAKEKEHSAAVTLHDSHDVLMRRISNSTIAAKVDDAPTRHILPRASNLGHSIDGAVQSFMQPRQIAAMASLLAGGQDEEEE